MWFTRLFKPQKIEIILRRGKTEDWLRFDPIILKDEVVMDVGTGKIKIGNGKNYWSQLPYEAEPLPERMRHGFALYLR